MAKIILPVNYPEIEGNLIFLAGPVIGAPRWQNEAIRIIQNLDSEVNIACPSYELDRKYFKDFLVHVEDCPRRAYEEWPEVDWQMHYLEEAFTKGCLLFWLADEEEHHCSYPYAQGSRAELFGKLTRKGNLVLGIERGFSGDEYTEYYFRKNRPETPIFSSLENTCEAAVEIARKNRM